MVLPKPPSPPCNLLHMGRGDGRHVSAIKLEQIMEYNTSNVAVCVGEEGEEGEIELISIGSWAIKQWCTTYRLTPMPMASVATKMLQ